MIILVVAVGILVLFRVNLNRRCGKLDAGTFLRFPPDEEKCDRSYGEESYTPYDGSCNYSSAVTVV